VAHQTQAERPNQWRCPMTEGDRGPVLDERGAAVSSGLVQVADVLESRLSFVLTPNRILPARSAPFG